LYRYNIMFLKYLVPSLFKLTFYIDTIKTSKYSTVSNLKFYRILYVIPMLTYNEKILYSSPNNNVLVWCIINYVQELGNAYFYNIYFWIIIQFVGRHKILIEHRKFIVIIKSLITYHNASKKNSMGLNKKYLSLI